MRRANVDGAAGGRHGIDECVFVQRLDAGDHRAGVEIGSGAVGVRGVAGKQRFHFLGPHFLVLVGDVVVEVEVANALLASKFAGQFGVVAEAAFDFAIGPLAAHRHRDDNRVGVFREHIGDHFFQVPAEGVNRFGLALCVVGLLRFVPQRWHCAAEAEGIDRPVIVVTELDDDVVVGFDLRDDRIPRAAVDKRAGREAGLGAVNDCEFGRVEVILEPDAPAFLSSGIDGGRRVAGDKQRGTFINWCCRCRLCANFER